MPGPYVQKRFEGSANVAPVLLKAAGDVLGDILGGERRQLYGRGLPVEGEPAKT